MGILIRHSGAINVPEEAISSGDIKFVSFEPMGSVNWLVVSSMEKAKEIIPNLFHVPFEESDAEMMLKLRKNSAAAKAIDHNTQVKIKEKYSPEAELKAIRTNDAEYKAFVEQVVAEHNAAKDALFSL